MSIQNSQFLNSFPRIRGFSTFTTHMYLLGWQYYTCILCFSKQNVVTHIQLHEVKRGLQFVEIALVCKYTKVYHNVFPLESKVRFSSPFLNVLPNLHFLNWPSWIQFCFFFKFTTYTVFTWFTVSHAFFVWVNQMWLLPFGCMKSKEIYSLVKFQLFLNIP